MSRFGIFVFTMVAIACAACGARSSISQGMTSTTCHAAPPVCVQSATDDACAAPARVDAECNDASHEWLCPAGARVYARPVDAPGTCLPFHDASTGVTALGGSLVRVPTDDGRCLWVAEDVSFANGTSQRNVAFEVDPNAPFGTCPTTTLAPPTPIVTFDGGDPSMLVQIDGGYRLGGKTHVLYRLFALDPNSTFGVTELGGGVGHWDGSTQRIVVPAPGKFSWGLDLDLGDAMIVRGDHAFVYGCGQPPQFLTESCSLASLDAADAATVVASDVFDSGPWISSVVSRPGGFEHVFAIGFGTTLDTHTANDVAGPWTKGASLGACDIPSADANSYCAGPVVHEELADPTRPSELPITYGIGSTGTRTTNPDDYWTRLVWLP